MQLAQLEALELQVQLVPQEILEELVVPEELEQLA